MTLINRKVVFKDLFVKSKFQPVIYKNKEIYPFDNFSLKSKRQKLRIIFEETNSEYLQAINLKVNGKIIINNQEIRNSIILREDTIPTKEINLEILSNNKSLFVKNLTIWKKSENKIMTSPDDGTAIIIEDLNNKKGKRYRCNDVIADDDFNDLIFRIEYAD